MLLENGKKTYKKKPKMLFKKKRTMLLKLPKKTFVQHIKKETLKTIDYFNKGFGGYLE